MGTVRVMPHGWNSISVKSHLRNKFLQQRDEFRPFVDRVSLGDFLDAALDVALEHRAELTKAILRGESK